MTRLHLSRLTLSAVFVTSTVASFLLDWQPNHLLNPQWHGHARFHGGLLLFTLAGISATGLWLLWRRSAEPVIAIRASAFLLAAYWTPLFYVNSLVPGSTLWAGIPGNEPRWLGHVVYPNLVVAGIFVVATAAAALIAKDKTRNEITNNPAARQS